MRRIGYILLIVAGVFAIISFEILNIHIWNPVYVPLSPYVRQPIKFAFVVDSDADYIVRTIFENSSQLDNNIEVSWSVKLKNVSVGENYSGVYRGQSWGYNIGKFKGVNGNTYTIEAHVKQDIIRPRTVKHFISVAISDIYYQSLYMKSAFLGCVAILIFFTACGLFVCERRQ